MSGFSDPILTGDGSLIRQAAKSPNYAVGTTGWSINADGSAEFNALTVRGNIVVANSGQGVFVYSGVPAAGNLIVAVTNSAGTDPFGNAYKQGVSVLRQSTNQFITLGPSGSLAPSLLFNPDTTKYLVGQMLPIATAAAGGIPFVQIDSPQRAAGGGFATLLLRGQSVDGTVPEAIIAQNDILLANALGVRVGDASTVASLASGRPAATDDALSIRMTGDTNSRLVITSNGKMFFGAGGATAVDTTLYRSGVNTLITDDYFHQAMAASAVATVNSPQIAPGAVQIIATVTVTAIAGRSYEIVTHWHGVLFVTPSAAVQGNRATFAIQRNGSSIAGSRIIGQPSVTLAQDGGTMSIVDTPGAGTWTYDLLFSHEATSLAAFAQVNATAQSPAHIYAKGFA